MDDSWAKVTVRARSSLGRVVRDILVGVSTCEGLRICSGPLFFFCILL